MNQTNQGDNLDTPPAVPVKRKRGRPRKDPSLKQIKTAPVTPGFGGVNVNQPSQVDRVDETKSGLVGQAVTGVVEAAFDAGYFLTVRLGNSNTSLRGVVFKPGHYVPVTEENDVAPHVQMIGRNHVHLPARNHTQVRGYNKRSRERAEQNGSPPANQLHRVAPLTANLVVSKGKYASPAAASSVPPVGARGTVVPVVLQPINRSNGLPPANQVPQDASQAAHMAALRDKYVQTVAPLAVLPPNASIPKNQVLAVTIEELPSKPQISHQVTPESMQNENGSFKQGTLELPQGEAASSLKSAAKPDEVYKVVSQSSETHVEDSKIAFKLSGEDVLAGPVQEIGDMNEPLSIGPLQAVYFDQNQSASVSRPLENRRTGRMTELLLENMTENQVRQFEHLAPETGEPRS
ncbi:unnamed protein product [Ilex paraguariensis]|uniref:AT hook motif-containing protein n=1 Tax=Ilex paraguariensis TaxID=185542 RepID=A0ABC8U161_9AQUA